MREVTLALWTVLALALTLTGCGETPSGPTVTNYGGDGNTFAVGGSGDESGVGDIVTPAPVIVPPVFTPVIVAPEPVVGADAEGS